MIKRRGMIGKSAAEAVGRNPGAATKILVGIFTGCSYYSTSQRKTVFNNYWPGSDATGDIEAYVVDDRVSHDSYGLGRIVGVDAGGATVDFIGKTVWITTPFRKMTKL